jgi:hypothetical protein
MKTAERRLNLESIQQKSRTSGAVLWDLRKPGVERNDERIRGNPSWAAD